MIPGCPSRILNTHLLDSHISIAPQFLPHRIALPGCLFQLLLHELQFRKIYIFQNEYNLATRYELLNAITLKWNNILILASMILI